MNITGTLGLDVGSLIGGWLNYKGQKQANDTNLEIARKNNEFNERMWHMQNEYNTPSAQMQRYREAGLNPNLIYGSTSNGNASSAPVATPVSVENTRAGDAFLGQMSLSAEGILNLIKKKEEIETQKATTDNIKAQTLEKNNENSLFGLTAEMRAAELENKLQQNFNLMQQRYLSKAQYDNLIAENENIKAQLSVIRKQAEKYGEDVLLTRANRRIAENLASDSDFWHDKDLGPEPNWLKLPMIGDTLGRFIYGLIKYPKDKISDFFNSRK